MKKLIALTLSAVSIGLISVSCTGTRDYDRELGWDKKFENLENSESFDRVVNARIDRDLNRFNAKDELRLPAFANNNAGKEFFYSLVFNTTPFKTLSLTYLSSTTNDSISFVFDKVTQTMTRTVRGKSSEEFLFSGNLKVVPPVDAYIPYAFAVDFTRIANKITLIDHVAYKLGTDATETFREPDEYDVNGVRCVRYDVELKKRCAPAETLNIYVDQQEKTPVRVQVNFAQPQPTEVGVEVEQIAPVVFNILWQEYKLTEDSEEVVTMPRIIEWGKERLVMFENPVIIR